MRRMMVVAVAVLAAPMLASAVYYGMQKGEGVEISDGYTPLPQGAVTRGAYEHRNDPYRNLTVKDGAIVLKSAEEIAAQAAADEYARIVSLPEKHRKLDEGTGLWSEKSAEEKMQADMAEWQMRKSPTVLMLEDMYIGMLTNDWTMVLRGYGIISNDFVVTVGNTPSVQNMAYLIALKASNARAYLDMSSQFDIFDRKITELTVNEIGNPPSGDSVMSCVTGSGQVMLLAKSAEAAKAKNAAVVALKQKKESKKSVWEKVKSWFKR